MSHSGFGAKTDSPPNSAFNTDFGTGGGQGFDGGDLCVIRDKIKGTKKMSVNLGL